MQQSNSVVQHNIIRDARGDMEVLCDWEDANLVAGDRVGIETVDPSGEWAYGEPVKTGQGHWIPRSILQHTLYTTRETYTPETLGTDARHVRGMISVGMINFGGEVVLL